MDLLGLWGGGGGGASTPVAPRYEQIVLVNPGKVA